MFTMIGIGLWEVGRDGYEFISMFRCDIGYSKVWLVWGWDSDGFNSGVGRGVDG